MQAEWFIPGAVMSDRESLFASREGWEWYGSPMHLIVSSECHFHLGTLVGP